MVSLDSGKDGVRGVGLTALSRKSFCSWESRRRRWVDDSEFREAGSGSLEGGAAEVVIEAWRG